MTWAESGALAQWLAGVATAFLCIGLFYTKRQLIKSNEQQYYVEYRNILKELPAFFFLKEDFSKEEFDRSRLAIYRYFDLCNEQLYQIHKKRISRFTAGEWNQGIKGVMLKEAVRKCWDTLDLRNGQLNALSNFIDHLDKERKKCQRAESIALRD